MEKEINFNPNTNPDVISIIRQLDGNYIGYTQKFGKMVEERQGDPMTVLGMLITHG